MASQNRPIVLVTEGSDAGPLQWLREQVEVIEVGLDSPELPGRLGTAQGMVVRTYTKVNQAMLDYGAAACGWWDEAA